MITTRQAARAVAALSLILLVPAAIGASGSSAAQPGTLESSSFHSATLSEDIAYNVYLPAGYSSTAKRYPVIYLLHGRGDSMSAWTQVKGRLDQLIADGAIPATIAIMPDAPWSTPGELLRRLAVQGLRPQGHERRPPGRDGVHEGPDRARRLDLPHARAAGRPRRRRLLDGRLRRDPLLARASRPVRVVDRPQPGRVHPEAAERLEHARVRRVRPAATTSSRPRSTRT